MSRRREVPACDFGPLALSTAAAVHRWFSDRVVLAMDTDVIVGHRASVEG